MTTLDSPFGFLAVAAARKLPDRVGPTFRFGDAEAVTGGFLLSGSDTTTYKSGPRKGEVKWLTTGAESVIVTDAEVRAEEQRYETETGRCYRCLGTGEVSAGWRKDTGPLRARCGRCGGTRKAPHG